MNHVILLFYLTTFTLQKVAIKSIECIFCKYIYFDYSNIKETLIFVLPFLEMKRSTFIS